MPVCKLTGKKRLPGYSISHAHNKTRKFQQPNVQSKRVFVPELGKYVRVKLSTRAIRSISRLGIAEFARRLGITLKEIAG